MVGGMHPQMIHREARSLELSLLVCVNTEKETKAERILLSNSSELLSLARDEPRASILQRQYSRLSAAAGFCSV